ncbi:outer membrane scaffolding protein for murein synthesis (MipA/OmpV family) [Pelomonas saccharophila]|uniref:Outer membrane scaffolding protein for murein synthesis (MipA/OmpV family) n=1 Tax=Roseateles saccharophilus TaxID=304 RepID=A0ABU1YSZ9_ROSSA|nr:MipA/OmpV family protein [Roseateles saccharophilus]MDR7271990.1 outer membrane scaffolding protein for murein synthesis (MipA/OmpV family) [Roseateles saccharophilus]
MKTVPTTIFIALCLGATAARAEEDSSESQPTRYLLGLSVANGPEYEGARQRETKLKPVWAAKIGRIRITTAGGSALLGFGRDGAGAGASTQLIETDRWRLGVSASMDGGRDSDDASTTRGLPDVRRTLRAKLYVNYSLTQDWNLGASASQDVLGHKGGLTASLDLGWRFYRSDTTEWTTGVGVSAANAQNMRSYFGVPASASAASGKPAYEPGAGLRDAHFGINFKHALSKHWFVFGGAGANRLLGPAADSPLVEKPGGHSAAIGLAWRN